MEMDENAKTINIVAYGLDKDEKKQVNICSERRKTKEIV